MGDAIETTIQGDKAIIKAPPGVNATGSFEPRETVKQFLENEEVKEVLLNLEAMERINSITLGDFVACHVACAKVGKKLRIVNAQPTVAGVLKMCHIDRIIEVERPQG
jgi:anti-anti-sigma factor